MDINSQKVKHFRKLLSDNRKSLLNDKKTVAELLNLKDLLVKIEDNIIEERSVAASKALSQMSEEERSMLSMTPDEKKFFIKYKAKNPKNPWTYFKEYQSKLQKEYNTNRKLPA